MAKTRNPPTAVDVVIELYRPGTNLAGPELEALEGIVLIERGRPPFQGKWALPGGFQEYGESLEQTAVREAKEETGLDVVLVSQLSTYSAPDRDPRGHVNSVGYIARATGSPLGADDAAQARVFPLDQLPELAFDHAKRIEEDYWGWRSHQSLRNLIDRLYGGDRW